MRLDRRQVIGGGAAGSLLWTCAAAAASSDAVSPEDHGAKGDGRADDTAALQRALDRCAADGGGVVRLTAGRTYASSTIRLRSHVTLDLAPGSVLSASTDRGRYRDLGCLLFAEDAENIAVTGTGTIEGNGVRWFPTLVEGAYSVPHAFLGKWNPLDEFPGQYHDDGRPRMIILIGCRNVRLTGFRIHDAPTWTIHPAGCEDLLIDGITIDNSLLVPNCDGIDIDRCRRVRVANSAIRAGDDCIVLKTSRNFGKFGDCEGVTVTNCTLESSSAGIKIEPEGDGAVRDAVVSGCTILRSNRGVAIMNRDGGTVERITLDDLVVTTEQHHPMWWGAAEPLALSNLPRRASMKPGIVRDIAITNLQATGESGLFFYGVPGSPTERIRLAGASLTLVRTGRYATGSYDLRPGETGLGIYKHRIAGVYAHGVADLALTDVAVRWGDPPPPNAGAALEAEGCERLRLRDFEGAAAPGAGVPARMLDAVTRRTARLG